MGKSDMTCARVKQYKSSNIGAAERHNERKNESYDNVNVVPERSSFNVHYMDTGGKSYMDKLRELEADGKVCLRGLRQDATLFDEIVIDVNTMYFERNGGYEYAKEFYEEAYHFIEEKFGKEYVISAVMHADEINKAATDELGKPVYHYHLHAIVLPVVDKEILWSKRCKTPELRGTVKEIIHQISHSKKWASNVPMVKDGQIVKRKNGKPKYRPSYSVLQDELFKHLSEKGFKGFQRGELGSTSEHLTSLQYQIEQDTKRLEKIKSKTKEEKQKYKSAHNVSLSIGEIKEMGKSTLMGNVSMSPQDHSKLVELATEGILSRAKIYDLREEVDRANEKYRSTYNAYSRVKKLYDDLQEKCKPFIYALEVFPELVKEFTEKIKTILAEKEARQQREREERKLAKQQRFKNNNNQNDTSR